MPRVGPATFEILATELVEEEIGLRVPVRRLRYKDGRNMPMRGDDFIGAGYERPRPASRFRSRLAGR
jgi:hypothetical protein